MMDVERGGGGGRGETCTRACFCHIAFKYWHREPRPARLPSACFSADGVKLLLTPVCFAMSCSSGLGAILHNQLLVNGDRK